MIAIVAAVTPSVPTGEQIKETYEAWKNLTASMDSFIAAAAWIAPWVLAFLAHASAWFRWPNTIPALKFLSGNYRHAENRN